MKELIELNSNLYGMLTRFGDYYPIRLDMNVDTLIDELETNFTWVQYNPRKNIDRQGLSITSLDGGLSGKPDLDSLYEYYKETGTMLDETNFKTPTPVYPYFEKILDPIKDNIGRTHVIKINQGGFFPPHRDNKHEGIGSFRLFMPINYDTDKNFFLLENNKMEFQNGKVYFIDTAKMHTLFNTSDVPFYFVVINVILNHQSVHDTLKHLYG